MRQGVPEHRIVWILGSPRSGSTWLLEMLAEHDRIIPVDEPLIGLHLGPFISDRPGANVEDLDASNFTLGRLAAAVPTYFFNERYADVWAPALGRLIRARLGVHARRRALVVVKEPNGSQAVEMLLRALPRSRLLFLLRDGRDVVDSELAAFARGSWMSRRFSAVRGIDPHERLAFASQAAHHWALTTEMMRDAFDAHHGAKLLVRYEVLLTETAGELRRIFDWLGLVESEVDAIVQRHSFRETDGGPGEFRRAAQPGFWRNSLTPQEQSLIQGIMGQTLRAMGYEPSEVQEN